MRANTAKRLGDKAILRLFADLGPRWAHWRPVNKAKPDAPAKWTKVPYQIDRRRTAKTDDPTTWTTLQLALGTADVKQRLALFLAPDPLTRLLMIYIDLDLCRSPITGAITPWAQAIIHECQTYGEVSPSGTGVKLLALASPDALPTRKTYPVNAPIPDGALIEGGHSRVEYTVDVGTGYSATTFNHLPGTPLKLRTLEHSIVLRLLTGPPAAGPLRHKPDAAPAVGYEPDAGDAPPPASEPGEGLPANYAEVLKLIPADERDVWLRIGGALHYATNGGEDGRAAWDAWSERCPRLFDPNDQERTWRSFRTDRPNPVTWGTVVHLARQNGFRPPAGEALVISRKTPAETAELFRRTVRPNLIRREEEWLDWNGAGYDVLEPEALAASVHRFLKGCVYVIDKKNLPFNVKPEDVGTVCASLRAAFHVKVSQPGWLPDAPPDAPDPKFIVAARNGLIRLDGDRPVLMPPTPAFFTRNALDFDYDPDAPAPDRWDQHLSEVWPKQDERDNIDALQLWFGYILTADASQQKGLNLVGPRRSGRSTILKSMTWVVGGKSSVASLDVDDLNGRFAFEPCLDKSLLTLADAKFPPRKDLAKFTSNLLRVIGQDDVAIDRKTIRALPSVTLGCRVVILSNDSLTAIDDSGALTGRFIYLRTHVSFYGREDLALEGKLRAERPGILNWAIEGYYRLRDRRRLLEPEGSKEEREDIEELNSPVLAFLRQRCTADPKKWEEAWVDVNRTKRTGMGWVDGDGKRYPGTVRKDDLVQAFKDWWRSDRQVEMCPFSEHKIHLMLKGQVKDYRPRAGEDRPRLYQGVELIRPPTERETEVAVKDATRRQKQLGLLPF